MDANREQVLVVDDEEDLRKAIVDILTLDGLEVDQAGSAECGRGSYPDGRGTSKVAVLVRYRTMTPRRVGRSFPRGDAGP